MNAGSEFCLHVFLHVNVSEDLLSVDDLEPLLHLAALCAPALLVSDQGDVRVLRDAVVTRAAVDAPPIIVVTQVIVAAGTYSHVTFSTSEGNCDRQRSHLCVNFK